MRLAKGLAVAMALVIATRLEGQGYFGQNQVQYDRFDWHVIETEHFLLHYYPQEHTAAVDAARMAERSYARLARVLGHQFREKKPIIVFASRTDFGQNNVTGDLGEGVEGVTDALRQRNIIYLQGDYGSLEHLLTHEMVHQFQYDIFARGKAGQGLQTLAQVNPPGWFAEGMAEYLSNGPDHTLTNTWLRDAALNGNLPTIEQMTERPDRFFPYRYGAALWEYIGSRWGDEAIGQIMQAVPNVGVERAFKRELGLSLEDLGDEWREAMQTQHLPQVATLERARKFSQPLLSERRSGGQIFLAPALSPDGNHIAFLSNGSFLRGQVFIDLWLGDARTGKRIKRLVKSTTNPDFEELRLLYSQSSFSPDGKFLAFTGQRKGKDVLYLLDVRRRRTVRRFDLPLEGVLSPSWSPDGRRLVFTGNKGGITDLFMVDVDGKNFRQLTNDRYGDVQPSWSPDGKTIAFASDRGADTDLALLRAGKLKIALYDLASGRVDLVPGQNGLNINPVWAPDSRSVIFVSDRTGIHNLFLYDFDQKEHFQLTDVIGGVNAFTDFSPVITWAHQADRLAYTYFEDGDYTIWAIDNPRLLKKQPYREQPKPPRGPLVAGRTPSDSLPLPRVGSGSGSDFLVRGADSGRVAVATPPVPGGAGGDTVPRDTVRRDSIPRDSIAIARDTLPRDSARVAASDSLMRQRSIYRSPSGLRLSAELPLTDQADTSVISVAALLDSAQLALPDTARFKTYDYKVRFSPEYVARPTIGYAQDNFGQGVFGGTTIVLTDLLGDHRLAFSGQVNGRLSEAQFFAGYTNLGGRLQYSVAAQQFPYFNLSGQRFFEDEGIEEQDITRYIWRQVSLIALRPRNRFTRFELGAHFNNIDRTVLTIQRGVVFQDRFAFPVTPFFVQGQRNAASLNYVAPYIAYVSDNALSGYTGGIMGRRYRFQVEPTVGTLRWIQYLADYRRYDPILFNFLTLATRVTTVQRIGRDEDQFRQYIGNPNLLVWLRGYDREGGGFNTTQCNPLLGGAGCTIGELTGSRTAVASAELRFPLVRRFDLGILPVSLPPVDGLVFAEAGAAWSAGQHLSLTRPDNYDPTTMRYALRSYGAGVRVNLFNFALLRWDYAIPLDQPGHKGFWTWSLGPSF